MGTVALTAQALGAGDAVEQRAVLCARAADGRGARPRDHRAAVAARLGRLRLMGATPEVTAAAKTYFSVRIWSAPFTLANYAMLGWLIGVARTQLGAGAADRHQCRQHRRDDAARARLGMGVAGAAAAALIAETAGMVGGLAHRLALHAR